VVVTVPSGGAGWELELAFFAPATGATGISATGGTGGGLAEAPVADMEARARTAQQKAGRANNRDGMRLPLCLVPGPGQIVHGSGSPGSMRHPPASCTHTTLACSLTASAPTTSTVARSLTMV
jgi:hypothetical protein